MKKVLVIGDVIVDRYIRGKQLGISAETPTVVAEISEERTYVGGAGLVVRNLLRLGCEVTLLTVADLEGKIKLKHLFGTSNNPITVEENERLALRIMDLKGWSVSEKLRCFVGDYKMVQYDTLNRGTYNDSTLKCTCDVFDDLLRAHDVIIVCDNRHGVMHESFIVHVMNEAEQRKPVFVDSQVSQNGSNHVLYGGHAATIFLNEREISGLASSWDSRVDRVRYVAERLQSNIVLKLGPDGAMRYVDGSFSYCDAPKLKAIDTCGAGDAFMAAYVANDYDLLFATRWASLSTTYVGTIVPRMEDYETAFSR
jgi:bifunctional ADP-heptose synthase (sugar kinase/adenylyltransferase)